MKKSLRFSSALFFFFSGIFLLNSSFLHAQTANNFSHNSRVNWSLNPYEHKVFIENQGQFNGRDLLNSSQIMYGVDNLSTQIYFTPKGLTYRYDIPNIPKEKEGKFESEEQEKEWEAEFKKKFKMDNYLVHLEWLGANPNPQIIAEDKAKEYYNYAQESPKGSISFVPSFKKITYKDLYPGIDVEYIFHKDQGIKYSLILHPGADLSKVKMKYTGADKVFKSIDGNIHISTAIGDIIDHAPTTFYEDHSGIGSRFSISGNVVSFDVDAYDKSKTVIVDPWAILIVLPSTNKAFEISKDATGNVYIYGGNSNFKIQKYTSAGALIWTYNSAWTNGPTWVGDMITDPFGTAYITSGSCSAIARVSNAGVGVWINTPGCTYEYWRLSFNCNYTTLITSGGSGTGYISNINMTTGAVIGAPSLISSGVEVRALTLGPSGNYYTMNLNNLIVCSPAFAVIYSVSHGYALGYSSPTYNGFGTPSGQNIIAVSNNFIYTTNASKLDQRNLATGAIINTATIPGGAVNNNSGLVVDNCGNVYAGSTTGVYKYDATLTPLTSATTTGAVYDICIGVGGEVYATGNGFLASLALSVPNCTVNLTLNTTATGTGCSGGNTGTATASVTGGSGAYTYSWSPSGQTSMTATGLSAGIYTVTVTDATACNLATQTVAVTNTGGSLALTTSTINPLCNGGNGSASVTATGGTGTLTYSWASGGQTTQTATGLITGTYTVTVTDNTGCGNSATVSITQPAVIVASVPTVVNVLCNGGSTGSATASGSGGTGTLTYSWNNGQGNQSATGLSAGTYTVTVKDANGCTKTASTTVTQPAAITLNSSSTQTTCGGSNGTAGVTAAGGTGAFTYSWNNSSTNQQATGLTAGTYTVKVTDANNCTNTTTATVTSSGSPVATISASTNVTCFGGNNGSSAVTVSGGTGALTYAWTPSGGTGATGTGMTAGTYTVLVTDVNGCSGSTTVTITQPAAIASGISTSTNVNCFGGNNGTATVTASGGSGTLTYSWSPSGGAAATGTGMTAGTYSVTITDANGCSTSANVIITEPTQLTLSTTGGSACGGQLATATSTAGGGTTGYTYLWSNAQVTSTATGLTGGTYTLTVTDNNGCTASATTSISVNPAPVIIFSASDTAGCMPLCVNFTCTTASISSWSWDFGDTGGGNTSTSQNPSHCYKNGGTFTVKLTVTDVNGCTATLTKVNYITVYPNVVADFVATPQPTTILNPTIQFTDQSIGASTWSWTFYDDGSTSLQQNPKHTYKDSGCFNVQLIADNQYNCPDTTMKQVCINGDYELFAPNAFTPDGDGLNDLWNVKGIGIDPAHFELYIFDRWGNLIFKCTDLYKGWNGHANGGKDIAQQDVYVWKVFSRDFQGGKHQYIGHVSLVR